MNDKIKEKIKNLPEQPGVYIMRDAEGKVIYVGKARVLKNRVKQYFVTKHHQYHKVTAMVANVDDFEYIITDTELEALILECNLIKRYYPYYNILLKDDKQFPYVRIDVTEDYPSVSVVRNVAEDKAKYFGPFIAAHIIKDILDNIYKIYPLRDCKKDIEGAIRRGERPCINYAMGRCIGPCTGKVTKAEYAELVAEVMNMISGNKNTLKKDLTVKMQLASQKEEYEKAALYRDKIQLVNRLEEKQKAGFPNLTDKDIFAAETGEKFSVVQAFLFRDGKLNYAKKYYFDYDEESKEEIMEEFLKQYYANKTGIPKQIYTSPCPKEHALMEEWLSTVKGSKVTITEAQRGDNKKLLDLASKNAKDAIKLKEGAEKLKEVAVKNLADALNLQRELKRIECYDISNIQGTDNVSAMVVFSDGKPDKKQYRKYKIKTVEGADDFASMNETLTRRLLRGLREGSAMPDLIIIDGGKGQLNSACDALISLGCEDIPIVSLAKKQEEIFMPNKSESIMLKVGSPEYRLVTAIRDETHRFAVTFHRQQREKRQTKSELDSIQGIGEARKKALMKHFSNLKNIKNASVEELSKVSGISPQLAQHIYDVLHLSLG